MNQESRNAGKGMVKPPKHQITYARSVIGALRAFIAGRPIQRKVVYLNGRWRDFDLGAFIGRYPPVQYRAKPARKVDPHAQ